MSVLHSVTGGVGQIILNRPDQMNAITVELAGELTRAIVELADAPGVNVIVIQGAGGNFCAGGDFNEVERLRTAGPDALATLFAAFRAACDAIAAAQVPVVAAVRGVAAAGGFELMQAADIVLVSEDARIADSHVNYGMVPGGGGSARLPRLVGRQRALGLLLSGDRISGRDAVRLGLAYRSYPPDEFDAGVAQFAQTLAGRRRDSVVRIKSLVNQGLSRDLQDALDAEIETVVRHISGAAGGDSIERFNGRGQEARA